MAALGMEVLQKTCLILGGLEEKRHIYCYHFHRPHPPEGCISPLSVGESVCRLSPVYTDSRLTGLTLSSRDEYEHAFSDNTRWLLVPLYTHAHVKVWAPYGIFVCLFVFVSTEV
jgi:hypothetical protein